MRKASIGAFALAIGFVTSKINEDRKNLKEQEKMINLISKQEEVLKTYEKWMEICQKGQSISNYLVKNKYSNVAIYGLGRLGKQLYRELICSDINVEYVIDRSCRQKGELYGQTLCCHPEEKLKETELIIITVPSEAKEIGIQLRKKVTCPVKSINEILFVIE